MEWGAIAFSEMVLHGTSLIQSVFKIQFNSVQSLSHVYVSKDAFTLISRSVDRYSVSILLLAAEKNFVAKINRFIDLCT